jgi:hypothetical protein
MKTMKLFSSNSVLIKKFTPHIFYNMKSCNFVDKIRDKEVAEEKFYFDKEESKFLSKI